MTSESENSSALFRNVIVVGTFLYAAIFLSLNMDRNFILGDGGVEAMGAWRIAQGELPHKDYVEITPPLSTLVIALSFKALGPTVFAERLVLLIEGLLLILGADWLVRRYTRDTLARVAAILFLTSNGVFNWPVPSHHWAVDVCALFALASLHSAVGARQPLLWAGLGGILCGCAVFSLQDQGTYLTFLIMILYFPLVPEKALRWRMFAAWTVGGSLVLGAFMAWLLSRGSVGEIWYQLFTWLATRYRNLPGNQAGIVDNWRTLLGQAPAARVPLYRAAILIQNAFITVLPVLGALGIGLAFWKKWAPRWSLTLLVAGGVSFLLGAFHRFCLVNLVWAAPALLVIVAMTAGKLRASDRPCVRRLATALLMLVTASSLIFTFEQLFGTLSRPAALDVNTPAGHYWTGSAKEAEMLRSVVQAIETQVPKGAPIFSTGFIPLVNFVTLHPNPTRYLFFVYPELHTDAQAQEVLASLSKSPQAWILLGREPQADSKLDAFLMARYEPVWHNGMMMLAKPLPTGRTPATPFR